MPKTFPELRSRRDRKIEVIGLLESKKLMMDDSIGGPNSTERFVESLKRDLFWIERSIAAAEDRSY